MTTTNSSSREPSSREPSSRNRASEPTSSSTNNIPAQLNPASARSRTSPPINTNPTIHSTAADFIANDAALDRSYASLRASIRGNTDDPIAQSAAADRSLAALRAQQDRSLQQLRDQQAQLATYQARYERLRSVNAADMRRLEQTYLERSASGRGGAADTLDDEQLALVSRIAERHLGNTITTITGRPGGGVGSGGIGRSTAVAGNGTGTATTAASNARLMRRINVHDLRGEENDGPVTMGLGWSVDGSRLYVGTEEGILGYDVNMKERMQFPAGEWL